MVEYYLSRGSFMKFRNYEIWPPETLAEMAHVLGESLPNAQRRGLFLLTECSTVGDYLVSEDVRGKKSSL